MSEKKSGMNSFLYIGLDQHYFTALCKKDSLISKNANNVGRGQHRRVICVITIQQPDLNILPLCMMLMRGPVVIVLCLVIKVCKKKWTSDLIKKSAYNSILVQKYLSDHPNAQFTPTYEKSILLSSPKRLPTIHSITLSVALITLFRNMEKIESDAPIRPHSFLHEQLVMSNANLAVVEKILKENGVTFTVGYDDDDSSSPLINKDRYCAKLPRIYCGVEPNNKVSVGLKTSRVGEEDHSVYTHSDQFKSGPIYQTPLSDEQLAIANNIDTSKSFKQWTDQQKDVFDLVKKDCTRRDWVMQLLFLQK
ncbi:uncharacterized protein LOC110845647 isoform X1 [Folsomia candida]|nr:uncharacterized protein LOC110845647 isoform X1 [Folsomia candida]